MSYDDIIYSLQSSGYDDETIRQILGAASSMEELQQLAQQAEMGQAMLERGGQLRGMRVPGRMARAASPFEVAGNLAMAYVGKKEMDKANEARKKEVESLRGAREAMIRGQVAQRNLAGGAFTGARPELFAGPNQPARTF